MREYEQQYQDGLTTDKEKYNLVVDAWSKCTDLVAGRNDEGNRQPTRSIRKPAGCMEMNSIYMMTPFRRRAVRRSR